MTVKRKLSFKNNVVAKKYKLNTNNTRGKISSLSEIFPIKNNSTTTKRTHTKIVYTPEQLAKRLTSPHREESKAYYFWKKGKNIEEVKHEMFVLREAFQVLAKELVGKSHPLLNLQTLKNMRDSYRKKSLKTSNKITLLLAASELASNKDQQRYFRQARGPRTLDAIFN